MRDTLGPHIRVLFLANNPSKVALNIEGEANAIREELEKPGVAQVLPLYVNTAASTDDLHEALLHAPNAEVLHLAGHGYAKRGVITVDPDGHPVAMGGADLARILMTFPNIRLVVLSACHSLSHADALAKQVPCAIGIIDALSDDTSRRFSRGLYKGLANGESVGDAYTRAQAFAQLDLPQKAKVIRLSTREVTEGQQLNAHWIKLKAFAGQPVATQLTAQPKPSLSPRAIFEHAVDGYEDVVLNIHPVDQAVDWKQCIPHQAGAQPKVIPLPIGQSGWHRQHPPELYKWTAALSEIQRGIREVKNSERPRVHVLAKMPYSLSAYLGRTLEQHTRDLLFYQESPKPGGSHDEKIWQAWGPALPEGRPAQETAQVLEWDLPNHTIGREIDVGLMVSVSRHIDQDRAERAMQITGDLQMMEVGPVGGPSNAAINERTIDEAAKELADLLQKLPAFFPHINGLHLFFSGPQALLMRAMGRVHLLPCPVYFYEWFNQMPSGAQYIRTLELREPRLVLSV